MFLASLTARQAEAKPAYTSLAENSSPTLNGFDGEGGNDADYANAEVRFGHFCLVFYIEC